MNADELKYILANMEQEQLRLYDLLRHTEAHGIDEKAASRLEKQLDLVCGIIYLVPMLDPDLIRSLDVYYLDRVFGRNPRRIKLSHKKKHDAAISALAEIMEAELWDGRYARHWWRCHEVDRLASLNRNSSPDPEMLLEISYLKSKIHVDLLSSNNYD